VEKEREINTLLRGVESGGPSAMESTEEVQTAREHRLLIYTEDARGGHGGGGGG